MSPSVTRLLGALGTLPVLVAGLWLAPVNEPADPPAPAPVVSQDGLSLHEVMEGLKDNLKALAQSVQDPAKRDGALEHVSAMQAWTLAGKALTPDDPEGMEAEALAAHRLDFRADMARLMIQLSELEIEILGGDTAEAWERITSRIFELREIAHEKFQQ